MTTPNPYHAINPAIRSRCQLFELKELETAPIKPDFLKEQLESLSSKDIQFTTYKEEKQIDIDGIKKAVDVDRFKIAQDSRKYILNNYDWSKKSNKILEVLK